MGICEKIKSIKKSNILIAETNLKMVNTSYMIIFCLMLIGVNVHSHPWKCGDYCKITYLICLKDCGNLPPPSPPPSHYNAQVVYDPEWCTRPCKRRMKICQEACLEMDSDQNSVSGIGF